jgi:hypothetical protein
VPDTLANTGIHIGWWREISGLKVAQQTAELALADRISAIEQKLEQCGHEPSPFRRLQRPGEIGDCSYLRIIERDHLDPIASGTAARRLRASVVWFSCELGPLGIWRAFLLGQVAAEIAARAIKFQA